MISRSQIEELRDKWRTTELNVAREYAQHVLLDGLFRGLRRRIELAFKGGTALRIVRGSPRFSEDLDFTGWGKPYHAGEAIRAAVEEAGKAGLELKLAESARTSGGWFAVSETKIHEWPVAIEWNVSLRDRGRPEMEAALIRTPLWPAYSVQVLPEDQVVFEKIDALLRRRKPRDFFDLYFILRERLGTREVAKHKKRLLAETGKLSAKSLGRELKEFVPKAHWETIKDLPKILTAELSRL